MRYNISSPKKNLIYYHFIFQVYQFYHLCLKNQQNAYCDAVLKYNIFLQKPLKHFTFQFIGADLLMDMFEPQSSGYGSNTSTAQNDPMDDYPTSETPSMGMIKTVIKE